MSGRSRSLAGTEAASRHTVIEHLLMVACALATALSLSACATSGEPAYCQQGAGERALTSSGGNPLLLGPALLASVGLELFCDGDDARSATAGQALLPLDRARPAPRRQT